MAKNSKNKVLDVNDRPVSFDTYAGEVQAVRGVTFQLHEGEGRAIVGESGCGKSVTAQTIRKLNPMPPARIPQGEVHLDGHDIVKANEKEMQKLRGKEVSMIFQDPMTCLNPTKPVGKQIVEAIRHHRKLSAQEAKEEAIKHLKHVNIPNAEERAKPYPHEFSGAMRQRVALIRTLATGPEILLLDEAFSALDYQTRLNVTDDVYRILKREQVTTLMVTHDIPESISMGDKILVLSARPAQVKEILSVDFGPGRSPLSCRANRQFGPYFDHIWKELSTDEKS